MNGRLPVDLAAPAGEVLQPSRWAVVWWTDGVHRQEAHFADRALAEAYASAHHGQIVPLAALAPWPQRRG